MFLGPEYLTVLVVVEYGQLGPPPQHDWERTVETRAHRRPQRLRPALDRTERGGRPVQLPHARCHLARAGEGRVEQRRIGRPPYDSAGGPSVSPHARTQTVAHVVPSCD